MFVVNAQSGHFIYPQDLLRKAGEFYYPHVDFDLHCEPYYVDGKPHWAFDNYRCGGAVDYNPSHLFYTQPGWGTFFEERTGRNKVKCVSYACDPELHRQVECEKEYDVGFIGNSYDPTGEREEYLKLIAQEFNCFISDSTSSDQLSTALSKCKVLFNHIRYEEINIRFFESLAIGVQVASYSPALHLYATEGESYLTFKSPTECVEKIKLLLNDPIRREAMSLSAREEALRNTYKHRVEEMLHFTNLI